MKLTLADLNPMVSIGARVALGLIAAVALVVLWWVLIGRPMADRQAAVNSRAGATYAGGDSRATAEAAKATADLGDRTQARAEQERTNHDEIVSAPGANEPVPPGVYDATMRSLCRRPLNHDQPACIRLRNASPADSSPAR